MRIFYLVFHLLLVCSPALAVDYTNNTTGAINGTTTCGGNERVRTFAIPLSFTVADVDLAFQATHTWRGDIQLTLQSPLGTRVELISPITTAAGNVDNYNIIFDDGASTLVNTGSHAGPDTVTAPPFGQRVRPSNPLSVFNNEPANGTWRLEICDAFPGEDDGQFGIATLSLAEDPSPPSGGTPLSCPIAEQVSYAWSTPGTTNGWAAGSLTNGYTIGTDIPMSIAVTDPSNRLIPRNGASTPVTATEFTGGGATQNSLLLYSDFATVSETISLVMNVGAPGTGVASIGFDIFDIDRNTWTDQVTVAGSLNGTTVSPQLTGAAFNTVSGNNIIGTALAASTSGAGSAEVVFTSPVDQITLTYGSGPSAPANPQPQVMSFFANLSVCPALMADLSAVKSVELANPTTAGLYMTPGNEVIYKITVTNGTEATASASDIQIQDTLPDNLTFISAETTGFTGGTLSNPTAQTDCTGGTCIIGFTGASLAENSTGEIRMRVRIQ